MEMNQEIEMPQIENIVKAAINLKKIISPTPLMKNINFSLRYNAEVYFKREDLQVVRSYKIRGAYNKISSLTPELLSKGVICASAGNHAQGVAYSCSMLKINGLIYMPTTTPNQKITQVEMFGREFVKVILVGDSFDDAYEKAMEYSKKNDIPFIHPFDDMKVIEGQGTVGHEIMEELSNEIDYVFVPIGGGGLASGLGSYMKRLSPHTKIIGVEPTGAPSMKRSLEAGEVVTLKTIDKFVDGAAVYRVGDITFRICQNVLDNIVEIPEGKICTTILKLYNEEAIVVEPAGALSLAALDFYKEEIVGKKVVCVISGSNNDITRTEEIKERSMLYEGLKHYFLVRFPQRAGALKEFVNDILGPTDDITLFDYRKKTNREMGPALVGVVVKHPDDFEALKQRMEKRKVHYEYLNDNMDLFRYII